MIVVFHQESFAPQGPFIDNIDFELLGLPFFGKATGMGNKQINGINPAMLSPQQRQSYKDQGYLILESQIPNEFLTQIDEELKHFHDIAKKMHQSNEYIDLEASHRPGSPRIRRIKVPHQQMESCKNLIKHESILQPVRDLLGPDLRLHSSKLNMKRAGYGAAVEWHQDWAFYPHTNDDILAVGVMLDDMTIDNGALLVIPETHLGDIYNHHANNQFVGAIDPATIDTTKAVPIIAPAGSISLHHVRLVHGSDLNKSARDRRLLLFEIAAADAFPIMGALSKLPSIEEYNRRMLCGRPTLEPRTRAAPIRTPLPLPEKFESIYQLQDNATTPAFARTPD